MHGFFIDQNGIADECAWLAEEEATHALRVLRLAEGEAVEALDGVRRYRAVIDRIEGRCVGLRIEGELPDREPALRVALYQGLPKGERMDYIAQKATELGVDAIVPVCLSRSVARPDARGAERQRQRWQRIAREATKQCGRGHVPEVAAQIGFAEALRRLAEYDAIIVPWEECGSDALRIAQAIGADARRVAILIGPEGGIAPEEIEALRGIGAATVTLGPRILRTDTAAICALTLALSREGAPE